MTGRERTLAAIRHETPDRIPIDYICGPDHHIKPDVAPATTLALFDAAAAFRG